MRSIFVVIAAIAIALVGLLPQVADSSDAPRGTLQDMLDYASSYSQHDDSLRAIIMYDIMLRAFSQTDNAQKLSVVCHDLVANVRPEDVLQFNRSFWHCREGLLIDWLGNIDRFRTVEPLRILGYPPHFPSQTGMPEGFVLLSFDISESGNVEHIQILESSIPVWEAPVVEAIRSWKFSPALYNGKPVRKTGVMQRFTFQYE